MLTLTAADAAWIHQQARRNPNDPQWDDGRDDAITDRAWDYREVPAKIREACANLDDQSFEVELTTLAVNFFLGTSRRKPSPPRCSTSAGSWSLRCTRN